MVHFGSKYGGDQSLRAEESCKNSIASGKRRKRSDDDDESTRKRNSETI